MGNMASIFSFLEICILKYLKFSLSFTFQALLYGLLRKNGQIF